MSVGRLLLLDQETSLWCLEVFEILLDVPPCGGTLLELSHFVGLQLLLGHTGWASGAQNTWDAVFNAISLQQGVENRKSVTRCSPQTKPNQLMLLFKALLHTLKSTHLFHYMLWGGGRGGARLFCALGKTSYFSPPKKCQLRFHPPPKKNANFNFRNRGFFRKNKKQGLSWLICIFCKPPREPWLWGGI